MPRGFCPRCVHSPCGTVQSDACTLQPLAYRPGSRCCTLTLCAGVQAEPCTRCIQTRQFFFFSLVSPLMCLLLICFRAPAAAERGGVRQRQHPGQAGPGLPVDVLRRGVRHREVRPAVLSALPACHLTCCRARHCWGFTAVTGASAGSRSQADGAVSWLGAGSLHVRVWCLLKTG